MLINIIVHANMSPLASSRLSSLCLVLIHLLSFCVIASPLASSSLALASPSATSTPAHPSTVDPAFLSTPGPVLPAGASSNDINLWYDGEDARLYIGSTCFSVNDQMERQVEVSMVPGTNEGIMRKVGTVVFPSADVKSQVFAILQTCGFKSMNPKKPQTARGHYFMSVIKKLVDTSKWNSIPVTGENGNDVKMVLESLLRDNKFLGKTRKKQGNHYTPY